jgi:hypothetical protein
MFDARPINASTLSRLEFLSANSASTAAKFKIEPVTDFVFLGTVFQLIQFTPAPSNLAVVMADLSWHPSRMRPVSELVRWCRPHFRIQPPATDGDASGIRWVEWRMTKFTSAWVPPAIQMSFHTLSVRRGIEGEGDPGFRNKTNSRLSPPAPKLADLLVCSETKGHSCCLDKRIPAYTGGNWFAMCSFPLTPALSLGERGKPYALLCFLSAFLSYCFWNKKFQISDDRFQDSVPLIITNQRSKNTLHFVHIL